MALNFPGPYEFRIFYTVDTSPGGALQHQMRLNFDIDNSPNKGDPFSAFSVKRRSGASATADSVIAALKSLMKPLWKATDMTIDFAEIWKYTAQTFDAEFWSTLSIGEAATGTGTTTVAGQAMYTFRTIEGGIMRVNVMEGQAAVSEPIVYADMSAADQNFVNHFTEAAGSWYLARDTSYPLAFLREFPGQNEAIFKARYRR